MHFPRFHLRKCSASATDRRGPDLHLSRFQQGSVTRGSPVPVTGIAAAPQLTGLHDVDAVARERESLVGIPVSCVNAIRALCLGDLTAFGACGSMRRRCRRNVTRRNGRPSQFGTRPGADDGGKGDKDHGGGVMIVTVRRPAGAHASEPARYELSARRAATDGHATRVHPNWPATN